MRIISGKYVGEMNVKCINCNSYYNYDELLKRDNSKPLNGADGLTMDDLISRDDYREILDEQLRHYDDGTNPFHMQILKLQREILDDMPAVDAVPVVHGRWEVCGDCGITRCSVCKWNFESHIDYKYCPHCGAKMDGRESE